MHAAEIVSRSLAAVVGGWLAMNAIVAAISVWLLGSSVTAFYGIGQWAFVPYLTLMVYAFGARTVGRAWGAPLALILVAGAALLLHKFP